MSRLETTRGVCPQCGSGVEIARKTANHPLHALMSLVTLGLWLPIWVLSSIRFGGWFCSKCGNTKRLKTFA